MGGILPSQPRLELIQRIYNTCKLVDCLEDFYVPLFCDLPPDAVGPLGKKGTARSPRRVRSTKSVRDTKFSSLRGSDNTATTSTDTEHSSPLSETDDSKKERRRKKEKRKRFKSLQT